jgi:O-antigen/teichoic acid export membrane protein
MLQRTYNFIIKNDFLRSSAIVFTANLFVGVLNYLLNILASRNLDDQFTLWVSFSSFYAIIGTFNSGFFTEINKLFSLESKKSEHGAISLYQNLVLQLKKPMLYITVILVFVGIISLTVFDLKSTWIYILLLFSIIISWICGLNKYLLLGMMHNLSFATTTIFQGVLRIFATVLLFYFSFGIWALPIGMIISILSGWVLGEVYIKKIINSHQATKNNKQTPHPTKNIAISSIKSTIILFSLTSLFSIAPIISERFLPNDTALLFAVIITFGQIIHFGSTAFVQAIITHAINSTGLKIYYFSIGLMSIITILITGIFYIFGPFMLKLLDKSVYIDQMGLILVFAIFVLAYNIVFISCQYLISHSYYRILMSLPIWLFVFVLSLIFSIKTNHELLSFIQVQVIFMSILATFFVIYILKSFKISD